MTAQELAEFIKEELEKLKTDNERLLVFQTIELSFCVGCGNKNPRCTCGRDE